LVWLLDLVLARWDMESPDYQQEYEKRSLVAPRRRPDNVTIDRAITDWIAAQPQNIRPGRIDLTPPGGDVPVVYPRMIDEILDWGAANFINGMQHEQILRVNALVDRNRISIVFDRPSPADGLNDLELHQPAAALPLKQSVRDTLDRWDGRSRVINSADGPRKLMLSFTVREKHPSPTTMAKAACVLVVNEEELIRDLLVAMLDVLGYQAVAASSVEQGLALLVAGDFKLIIAGQDLPGGVDFARQARAHRADALIIALGEPARTEPEAGTAGWSDTTLTTPFRIDDLRAILETARN